MTDKIRKTEAEWREDLSPEQYHVLREGGTERAFTGKYESNKAEGMYRCAGCGTPLFSSETKYNSGSGWPSYTAPVESGAVEELRDVSHGMVRTEVHCRGAILEEVSTAQTALAFRSRRGKLLRRTPPLRCCSRQ